MSPCLILALKLCLFDPGNLVIEGEASTLISGDYGYWEHQGFPYHGSIGRIAIFMEIPIHPRFEFHYGIEHRSYIQTNRDRGEERAFMGFQWRPFAKGGFSQ